MQTAIQLPTPSRRPVITDVTVVDADLIRTSNPFIQTIHIWLIVFGEQEPQQHEMCGHDMLNWLCNVENRNYPTMVDYWYSTHPRKRDEDVAKYVIHRTNKLN